LPPILDWRSSETAEELHKLERPGFAWEFLRRNHSYRRAYKIICRQQDSGKPDEIAIDAKLAHWGLSFRVRSSLAREPGQSRVASGIHSDSDNSGTRATEISRSDKAFCAQTRHDPRR